MVDDSERDKILVHSRNRYLELSGVGCAEPGTDTTTTDGRYDAGFVTDSTTDQQNGDLNL